MFEMSDEVLLGNGIKVIDGIAGGGKSSMIDGFFRSHDIDYARFTSTNRLRRDATDRYNMDVKTIAAGLFENHGMHFYAEEKEAPSKYVVIDEILQSDPKAIDWCLNHANENDIIVTTDSRQMLSPENEESMKRKFDELCRRPEVVYRNVTETLRPRNKKTKKIYDLFYSIADTTKVFNVKDLVETFPNVITYEDMEYNVSDAYITHDNMTEDYLYRDKSFAAIPNIDLIPKGCLASKPPKDLTRYPVLSQLEAEKTHTRSYTQVMNVGTAVRFQGSEVTDSQKLYYMVQPTSMVSAREIYTVITRMWDISSFVIVLVDTPKSFVIKTFRGLPVKTHKYLTVNETGDTIGFTNQQMEKFMSNYDTDDIYYDRDVVKSVTGYNKYVRIGSHRTYKDEKERRKPTAASIAKRDAKLNYSYMDMVYAILDRHGIKQARGMYCHTKRDKDEYEIDIFSAHPTMLKFEKMPIDGTLKTDGPHDDMLNFYVYHGTKYTDNSIITDDMVNYIRATNAGECEYLFSTPYTIGCFPGDWLYEKAHNTQESKKEIKEIHYGYYQKPFLKLAPTNDCYVRYENYIYELLMCQILSQLIYYMARLYEKLNGSSIIVDAVEFPCYNKTILEEIKKILPEYVDFRIRDKDKTIIYQTYENLPTKQEKKVAQRRALREKNRKELEAIRRERSKK